MEPTEIKPSGDNKAGNPKALAMDPCRWLLNQHSDLYADLHEGDTIVLFPTETRPAIAGVTGHLKNLRSDWIAATWDLPRAGPF